MRFFKQVITGGINFIRCNLSTTANKRITMKYISMEEAKQIDEELMNDYKYSLEQLMELAGHSCASAIADVYTPLKGCQVLIICGPGNNGGDGLVCARHLQMFGFKPFICYPQEAKKPLFKTLLLQCEKLEIPFVENPTLEEMDDKYKIIVDALFGFGFQPPIREKYVTLVQALTKTDSPVASIDVPSGWVDVQAGCDGFRPEMVISLTAPKICVKDYDCLHYLGGRFVPPKLEQKYELNLPRFTGSDCYVHIPSFLIHKIDKKN